MIRKVGKVAILGIVIPFRRLLHRLLLVILIAAVSTLLVLARMDHPIAKTIRAGAADIWTPVVSVISAPLEAVWQIKRFGREVIFVYRENKLLRLQNSELLRQQSQLPGLKAENDNLRQLLHFLPEPEISYVATRIITDASGPYGRLALVRAGGKDGVVAGQVVINEKGVVGRVLEAGKGSARVLLLTDFNSRIPVVSGTSRERGILMGNNSPMLEIIHLPLDKTIQTGEVVYTSGDGAFFPANLPVGIVEKVEKDKVWLKPFVNMSHLEYVMIGDYRERD